AEGSLSPDGRRIVFASNQHAYSELLSPEDAKLFELDKSYMVDIYIMNADGSNVRRLTDVKGYDGGPFFSPDGKRIGWRRFSVDGTTAEIYTMNVDGSDQRQVTHMGTMSWAPYYHPSGEYFIFTTNKYGFGNFELYMVDVAGRSDPVRITYTPRFDGLPSFSWDGITMCWTSERTPQKRSQVFVAEWNHQKARQLLGLDQPARGHGEPTIAQPGSPSPSTKPQIRAQDARAHVERLASEEMEGRLTGSHGARLATQYVASAFERLGLVPAGDNGTYFQEFDFTAGVSLGAKNELTVHGGDASGTKTYKVDEDWRPLALSNTGRFEPADVVFAGYGIVAPKTDEFEEYDSFVHLDVKDKWVMVFRFMPEEISPQMRQHLGPYSHLRNKVRVVRDQGAAGLIVVSGPNSSVKNQLVAMKSGAIFAGTSIPAISISDEVASVLLRKSAKDLKELQSEWDTGKPQMGFAIPDVKVRASIDIEKVTHKGRNVLARLPAHSGSPTRPAVVIGAHIDHLGRGSGSGSLARDDEKDQIHYGADDNASGVAGLLEIAEYLVHQTSTGPAKRDPTGSAGALERDVIFAAWSGEELGLLGSKHFVAELAKQCGDPDNIRSAVAAYLNMDMIGRLDQQLIVNGTGSSSIWPGEIERRNAPVGLSISAQADASLPTDATSFYMKGVPVLSVFTGSHSEYHSPRDTPEKLNYPGLARVARFTALVARSLAAREDVPDYIVMKKTDRGTPRAGLRAYLGTVPDYGAAETLGLKLSSVTPGAPAEQAGVKSGDIIVQLAGRKIENIYDYTDAIGALKVGQSVEIVVLRDRERLTLTITPGSRE
ncbi:MAG: M28 family peptidase, partial [Phycisphaeraceae bacterium]